MSLSRKPGAHWQQGFSLPCTLSLDSKLRIAEKSYLCVLRRWH